jgi:hypothetical protein
MKKEKINNLINQLKKNNPLLIQSVVDLENTPRVLAFRGNRSSFTPDIIAIYDHKRDFFAIENKIKKKELPQLISKWILFGLEARKNKGKFYIVTEKKHSEKFQKIIDDKQLSAQLITI